MASTERFLFVFSYHRVGATNLWRSGGSTLGRVGLDQPWEGPGVRVARPTERIVSIDVAVAVEEGTDREIDELSRTCEEVADAEFRKVHPDAELAGPA